jgi:pyruvate dehydrogenase E1 component
LAQYGIGVELWSATSYKALRDDALSAERWNRLHPGQPAKVPLVAQLLADAPGPVVAVSDFMKIVPEQVARFLPGRTFVPLGTDGMGRSDTRDSLRGYFEVNTGHVVVAVLSALAADGKASPDEVQAAIARHGIDPGSPDPLLV